jgi:hypothetical protein
MIVVVYASGAHPATTDLYCKRVLFSYSRFTDLYRFARNAPMISYRRPIVVTRTVFLRRSYDMYYVESTVGPRPRTGISVYFTGTNGELCSRGTGSMRLVPVQQTIREYWAVFARIMMNNDDFLSIKYLIRVGEVGMPATVDLRRKWTPSFRLRKDDALLLDPNVKSPQHCLQYRLDQHRGQRAHVRLKLRAQLDRHFCPLLFFCLSYGNTVRNIRKYTGRAPP